MLHWIYTIFVFLHGLVHMVYVAFARGWMTPETGEDWTGKSWLMSGWLDEQGVRNVGTVLIVVVMLLFIITAIGLGLRQGWSLNWLAASAILSSLALIAVWDGQLKALTEKGLIGVLINIALLIGLYVFRYPAF